MTDYSSLDRRSLPPISSHSRLGRLDQNRWLGVMVGRLTLALHAKAYLIVIAISDLL